MLKCNGGVRGTSPPLLKTNVHYLTMLSFNTKINPDDTINYPPYKVDSVTIDGGDLAVTLISIDPNAGYLVITKPGREILKIELPFKKGLSRLYKSVVSTFPNVKISLKITTHTIPTEIVFLFTIIDTKGNRLEAPIKYDAVNDCVYAEKAYLEELVLYMQSENFELPQYLILQSETGNTIVAAISKNTGELSLEPRIFSTESKANAIDYSLPLGLKTGIYSFILGSPINFGLNTLSTIPLPNGVQIFHTQLEPKTLHIQAFAAFDRILNLNFDIYLSWIDATWLMHMHTLAGYRDNISDDEVLELRLRLPGISGDCLVRFLKDRVEIINGLNASDRSKVKAEILDILTQLQLQNESPLIITYTGTVQVDTGRDVIPVINEVLMWSNSSRRFEPAGIYSMMTAGKVNLDAFAQLFVHGQLSLYDLKIVNATYIPRGLEALLQIFSPAFGTILIKYTTAGVIRVEVDQQHGLSAPYKTNISALVIQRLREIASDSTGHQLFVIQISDGGCRNIILDRPTNVAPYRDNSAPTDSILDPYQDWYGSFVNLSTQNQRLYVQRLLAGFGRRDSSEQLEIFNQLIAPQLNNPSITQTDRDSIIKAWRLVQTRVVESSSSQISKTVLSSYILVATSLGFLNNSLYLASVLIFATPFILRSLNSIKRPNKVASPDDIQRVFDSVIAFRAGNALGSLSDVLDKNVLNQLHILGKSVGTDHLRYKANLLKIYLAIFACIILSTIMHMGQDDESIQDLVSLISTVPAKVEAAALGIFALSTIDQYPNPDYTLLLAETRGINDGEFLFTEIDGSPIARRGSTFTEIVLSQSSASVVTTASVITTIVSEANEATMFILPFQPERRSINGITVQTADGGVVPTKVYLSADQIYYIAGFKPGVTYLVTTYYNEMHTREIKLGDPIEKNQLNQSEEEVFRDQIFRLFGEISSINSLAEKIRRAATYSIDKRLPQDNRVPEMMSLLKTAADRNSNPGTYDEQVIAQLQLYCDSAALLLQLTDEALGIEGDVAVLSGTVSFGGRQLLSLGNHAQNITSTGVIDGTPSLIDPDSAVTKALVEAIKQQKINNSMVDDLANEVLAAIDQAYLDKFAVNSIVALPNYEEFKIALFASVAMGLLILIYKALPSGFNLSGFHLVLVEIIKFVQSRQRKIKGLARISLVRRDELVPRDYIEAETFAIANPRAVYTELFVLLQKDYGKDALRIELATSKKPKPNEIIASGQQTVPQNKTEIDELADTFDFYRLVSLVDSLKTKIIKPRDLSSIQSKSLEALRLIQARKKLN